jgi:hypothetical protein
MFPSGSLMYSRDLVSGNPKKVRPPRFTRVRSFARPLGVFDLTTSCLVEDTLDIVSGAAMICSREL